MNPAQAVASYVESLRIGQGRHAGERFRLLGWQRKFLRGAFGQDADAALSMGRGGGGRFRVQDSANRASIQDKETGALVRVLGSDPRRLHGAAPRILLLDELAQWPPGQVAPMLAALTTSRGKIPGSKALWIGTRPSTSDHPFQRALDGTGVGFSLSYAARPSDPAIPAADVAQGKPRPRSFSRPGGGDPPRGEGREAR